MIAVGLAVPSALGHVTVRVGARIVLSTFFGTAAMIYAVIAAITGGNAMLCHGTEPESGPTLMIVVPIVTVSGIMFMFMFMCQPDAPAPRNPRNRNHRPQNKQTPNRQPSLGRRLRLRMKVMHITGRTNPGNNPAVVNYGG
jgi:hypothetical protein